MRSAVKPAHPALGSAPGAGPGEGGAGPGGEGSRPRPRPPRGVGAGSRVGSTGAALAARHGWAAGTTWPGGKSGRPATAPGPLAPGSRHPLRSTALGLGLVPPGAGRRAAAHGPQGLP